MAASETAVRQGPQDSMKSDVDRPSFDSLLAILNSWSNTADHVNDHGTMLIGHEPSIAPKAYRHVVYAGLSAEQHDEFQSRAGRPIPKQYLELLAVANGMMLFSGAIRFYGYVQLDRWGGNTIHNFPPNVMGANSDKRMVEAAGGHFLIGWYKEDGSYVYVDEAGRAARFNLHDVGNPIDRWDNIGHWLEAEIGRLGKPENDLR